MEVLILGVYFEIFLFRMKWSKIRVRIIHGRVLYTGKYGTCFQSIFHSFMYSFLYSVSWINKAMNIQVQIRLMAIELQLLLALPPACLKLGHSQKLTPCFNICTMVVSYPTKL